MSLAAIAIGGCSSLGPGDADLPIGAVPMVAGPQYQEWFARTQACSGLSGQVKDVQWFVVPNADVFETRVGPKVGMWEKTGGAARIIIAGRYTGHEMVIRHEMLHHLLDRSGHPSEFFVDRCKLTWESWTLAAGPA